MNLRRKRKTIFMEKRKADIDSQLYTNRRIVELRKENEELHLDNFACKEENTKLAKIIKSLEEKLQRLNEAVNENDSMKKKNQNLTEESETLKSRTKSVDEEMKKMGHEISTLTNDVEYYKRSTSDLQSNARHLLLRLKTSERTSRKKINSTARRL